MSELGEHTPALVPALYADGPSTFSKTELQLTQTGKLGIIPSVVEQKRQNIEAGTAMTRLATDQVVKDIPDDSFGSESLTFQNNQRPTRQERRALRKTPAFKAAWKESRLDGREPRRLTQPDSWFNPEGWFDAEQKLTAASRQLVAKVIEVAYFDQARKDVLAKQVDRRSFTKGLLASVGLAAAVGGGLAIRHEATVVKTAMREQWSENQATFNFLNNEIYKGQKQIAIFFPGFGDMHSEAEAAAWHSKGHLKKDVPTAFLDYSNQGASPRELADIIRESVDISQLDSLILFGRSMGGPMEIAVAAELGIPVKSMILCSSPFQIEDGTYGKFGKDAAHIPSDKQLAAEVKVDFNLWRAFRRHGYDLPDVFAESWYETMNGASPWALQKEEKFLADFDFYDPDMDEKLRKVFIHDWTDIVYAESDHPPTDLTVRDIRSSLKYVVGLQKCFGIRLKIGKMPFKGHANVSVTAETLKEWINDSSRPKPPPKILAAK